MDGSDVDLWEMYRDYIDGKKEIAECNASFSPEYMGTDDTDWWIKEIFDEDYGCEGLAPGEKRKCIVRLMNNWDEQKDIRVEEESIDKFGLKPGCRWPDELIQKK